MTMNTSNVGQVVTPAFIDSLDLEIRPKSLFLQVARVLPARKRTGSFTLPAQIATGPTVGWLGEGEVKPVSSMTFDRDIVHMKKCAVLVPFSEELEMDSYLSIPETIRAAIVRAAVEEIDSKMWNGSGGTDAEPFGLLTQSGSFQSVSSTGAIDLDMERMVLALRVANHRATGFVMSEATLHKLQVLKDLDGKPRLPETRTAGAPSFMGIPIFASNNLPITATTDGQESAVIAADWSMVETYIAPSSFMLTDSATIVDGGDEIHLFQRDMKAIRFVQHISDVRVRMPDAVCIMSDVETAI